MRAFIRWPGVPSPRGELTARGCGGAERRLQCHLPTAEQLQEFTWNWTQTPATVYKEHKKFLSLAIIICAALNCVWNWEDIGAHHSVVTKDIVLQHWEPRRGTNTNLIFAYREQAITKGLHVSSLPIGYITSTFGIGKVAVVVSWRAKSAI